MEFIYLCVCICMYGVYISVQPNRHTCHCVTPVYTGACALFEYTYTCVCVCVRLPPPVGPGWGGAGSRFPIPRSRFPSRRLALGDDEPMARKEPLLSALKGERGAPGTSGSSFLWPARHRSDRTDGGAALGLRGTLPEFLPGSAAAAGEGRTGPGRGVGPSRGALQSCPEVSFPRLGTQGCRSLSLPLTGAVLRLREGGGPCTDTCPHLVSLCQLLESVLRKGLRRE